MGSLLRRGSAPLIVILLTMGVSGCGDDEPVLMPDLLGKTLDLAKSDVDRAGYEDEVEVVGGGLFGVVDESNWTVCSQEPPSGAPITTSPRVIVERDCNPEAEESTTGDAKTAQGSASTSGDGSAEEDTEPAEESTPEPSEEPPLTAASDEEFAKVLAETDYCSDSIMSFAETNAGRTIEFDGSVGDIMNEGSATTRYRILINAGPFSESEAPGPAFQFRDVNMNDLNMSGEVPDALRKGQELHIVAEIDTFEESSCLLLLDPISTTFD
ncbi:DUF4839 domain-containing protein [Ornithinimicrobium panacihumi]|uniref:DUF4839 domain-containing protein n=1 Tax=Ornithinimicrobium panacihumi TaxID=2008449 RepID=UPI003F8C6562